MYEYKIDVRRVVEFLGAPLAHGDDGEGQFRGQRVLLRRHLADRFQSFGKDRVDRIGELPGCVHHVDRLAQVVPSDLDQSSSHLEGDRGVAGNTGQQIRGAGKGGRQRSTCSSQGAGPFHHGRVGEHFRAGVDDGKQPGPSSGRIGARRDQIDHK